MDWHNIDGREHESSLNTDTNLAAYCGHFLFMGPSRFFKGIIFTNQITSTQIKCECFILVYKGYRSPL